MPDKPLAWITGAAGGIGRAVAAKFARAGYDLVLTDLNTTAVAEEIAKLGCKALCIPGDLSDLSFVDKFAQQAADELGVPHALINNAAWRELLTMREVSIASWEKTLRVCLTAPAFLAREAASRMETLRRGVIVNVSSMMSQRASGIAPAYVAAKGAMDSLTYDLAALYGPAGIRVVAINPGAVDTSLSAAGSDQARQWTEEMISLRRWASPHEIARAIAWIASDSASYLTGTTITLDGGWTHQLYPYGLKHSMKPDQFP